MKAKNPELRCVVLDHFHCLARHKGSPQNEAAMMEERAYRLMTAAKELDIDLIVLAQMNRVGMDSVSRNQAPQLNEIRGTDALSHVSHAVWIIRNEQVEEGGDTRNRKLELWHVKVRGRQAYWNSMQQRVVGIDGFIEKSVIAMHHATSSIKEDDTKDTIRLFERNRQ
jgi:replicative DNA helicase